MTYPLNLPGRSVLLRDFRPDDAQAVLAIVGDDRVTRWLSFDSRDHEGATTMVTAAIAAAQTMPRTEYYLAVAVAVADELIGFIRLALSGVRAAKLGYAIHADHQGHGYATDAAETMINFGFNQLHLHRITAAIGPDNEASQTVIKRLGFTYEGRLRDHVFANGAWRDSLLFSKLTENAEHPAQQDQSGLGSAQTRPSAQRSPSPHQG